LKASPSKQRQHGARGRQYRHGVSRIIAQAWRASGETKLNWTRGIINIAYRMLAA